MAFLLALDFYFPSASMMRMILPTPLKCCDFQMKRTLSDHPEITLSLWLLILSSVSVRQKNRCHLGSEQSDFIYTIHWPYSKGSNTLIYDFFDRFLLGMWHLVVFNLIPSIWDSPLDTVFIDHAMLSYWFLVIWSHFLLLYIHCLLTSGLIGELPVHTH